MPAVRRVFVIYDPQQNAWLIHFARDAAKLHGLELVSWEATGFADRRCAIISKC